MHEKDSECDTVNQQQAADARQFLTLLRHRLLPAYVACFV